MFKSILSSFVLHLLFVISLIFKAINGLLEIFGGVFLAIISPDKLNSLIILLTQSELSEDPKDFIANLLISASNHNSANIQLFGTVYLLTHGLIKIILVISLLRRKLWAYPAAIIFFSAFIIYQLYRFGYNHSLWLMALTILDIFVVILTWLEYKRLMISEKVK